MRLSKLFRIAARPGARVRVAGCVGGGAALLVLAVMLLRGRSACRSCALIAAACARLSRSGRSTGSTLSAAAGAASLSKAHRRHQRYCKYHTQQFLHVFLSSGG